MGDTSVGSEPMTDIVRTTLWSDDAADSFDLKAKANLADEPIALPGGRFTESCEPGESPHAYLAAAPHLAAAPPSKHALLDPALRSETPPLPMAGMTDDNLPEQTSFRSLPSTTNSAPPQLVNMLAVDQPHDAKGHDDHAIDNADHPMGRTEDSLAVGNPSASGSGGGGGGGGGGGIGRIGTGTEHPAHSDHANPSASGWGGKAGGGGTSANAWGGSGGAIGWIGTGAEHPLPHSGHANQSAGRGDGRGGGGGGSDEEDKRAKLLTENPHLNIIENRHASASSASAPPKSSRKRRSGTPEAKSDGSKPKVEKAEEAKPAKKRPRSVTHTSSKGTKAASAGASAGASASASASAAAAASSGALASAAAASAAVLAARQKQAELVGRMYAGSASDVKVLEEQWKRNGNNLRFQEIVPKSGSFFVIATHRIDAKEAFAWFPDSPPSTGLAGFNPLMALKAIPFATMPGFLLDYTSPKAPFCAATLLMDIRHYDWMPDQIRSASNQREANNACFCETHDGQMYAVTTRAINAGERIWVDFGQPYWYPNILDQQRINNGTLFGQLWSFMPVLRLIFDQVLRQQQQDPYRQPLLNSFDIFLMVGFPFLFFCGAVQRSSEGPLATITDPRTDTLQRRFKLSDFPGPVGALEAYIHLFSLYVPPGMFVLQETQPTTQPTQPTEQAHDLLTKDRVNKWLSGQLSGSPLRFPNAQHQQQLCPPPRRYSLGCRMPEAMLPSQPPARLAHRPSFLPPQLITNTSILAPPPPLITPRAFGTSTLSSPSSSKSPMHRRSHGGNNGADAIAAKAAAAAVASATAAAAAASAAAESKLTSPYPPPAQCIPSDTTAHPFHYGTFPYASAAGLCAGGGGGGGGGGGFTAAGGGADAGGSGCALPSASVPSAGGAAYAIAYAPGGGYAFASASAADSNSLVQSAAPAHAATAAANSSHPAHLGATPYAAHLGATPYAAHLGAAPYAAHLGASAYAANLGAPQGAASIAGLDGVYRSPALNHPPNMQWQQPWPAPPPAALGASSANSVPHQHQPQPTPQPASAQPQLRQATDLASLPPIPSVQSFLAD